MWSALYSCQILMELNFLSFMKMSWKSLHCEGAGGGEFSHASGPIVMTKLIIDFRNSLKAAENYLLIDWLEAILDILEAIFLEKC